MCLVGREQYVKKLLSAAPGKVQAGKAQAPSPDGGGAEEDWGQAGGPGPAPSERPCPPLAVPHDGHDVPTLPEAPCTLGAGLSECFVVISFCFYGFMDV